MLLSYSVPLNLPEENGVVVKRKISIQDKGPAKRIKLDEN